MKINFDRNWSIVWIIQIK